MKKYILLIMFISVCSGADYFVSVQGSDENPGSIDSPFLTIQKAADIVEGGDVINIMEGSYREQITLDGVSGSDGAPILFKSFDNDRVVIDGTKLISTAWTIHQGNIWKTQIDFDIWQLFLDRKEQVMARWPNANFDDGSIWDKENHWAHGTMDQSQEPAYENGTLVDKPHGDVDLSSIGFSVVDAIAILNVGSFRTWTRKINTHSGSTITYDLVPDNEWKVKHHDYYLEGKIEFLDNEGEWFFNTSDKMLYFWSPQGQDPNELSIRGKVQSYAFNISNSDYVEIHGLEFFGTTFQFDNCDYSKVENCNLWYPSCHKRMLGITDTQPDMSVFRSSSHCKVSKSAFRYTDGSALEMYSHDNTIEDCYFYHIDYSVTDLNSLMTTIQMGGANNIIRRNTMHKLGASATLNPGDAGLITLNNISDTGHMQGDGAMVQIMTGQSPGTEISYNWLHSSVKYGARFDGNGTGNNGIMHHNVFWGLDNAGIMAKGYEFKIYNNTVLYGPDNKNDILIMIDQGGNEGTETFNNVANKISGHRSGTFEDYPVPGIYSNNVNGYELGRNIEGLIMDPDNLDFRPNPDSILVDAGLAIDGFTDGYVGTAPDIGAYEYGAEMWVPGITWDLSQKFGDEFIEPSFNIADHRPEILSLRDVPNDQGKQMQIVWKPGQVNPSLLFTQFSTWRKVNPDSMQQDTTDLWDSITTVPWIGTEDEYSLVVPTLGDSTAHGIHHSMFRVTAHTEDVELYHVSEPVTGFSIDNLHPTVPQGLMALESGSSVILQWTTQIEEDFSYHNIYRNDLNSFDPAMVFTTTDSFYVDIDMNGNSWEYWITAVDSAGNESDATESVSVLLANELEIAIPTVFALEQNYPNPFNPSTQIRYALPEATSVVITVYDMMGRKVRTLVQDTQSAGYHTALWNATNDRGLPVSAGMYIYTLLAGNHHHMKKMVMLK